MDNSSFEVLKYVNPEGTVAGIKGYRHRCTYVSHVLELVEICKKDFPTLINPEGNIEVVLYRVDGWWNHKGIEFELPPNTPIPSDYKSMASGRTFNTARQ